MINGLNNSQTLSFSGNKKVDFTDGKTTKEEVVVAAGGTGALALGANNLVRDTAELGRSQADEAAKAVVKNLGDDAGKSIVSKLKGFSDDAAVKLKSFADDALIKSKGLFDDAGRLAVKGGKVLLSTAKATPKFLFNVAKHSLILIKDCAFALNDLSRLLIKYSKML